MLALVFFAGSAVVAGSLIYNNEILMISLMLGILVLYGGPVALASYYVTHERLGLVEQSLWQIRESRIPLFAEVRRYAGLFTFALLSPLVLAVMLSLFPGIISASGVKDETLVVAFTISIPPILVLGIAYVLFRWETARNARHDKSTNTPRALYLRSFSEDASLVLSDLSKAPIFRFAERALGRIFSVERLVLRALIERRFAGIAVGAPGERLPPLGFERLYFSEQEWQGEVASLISTCRLVIVNCSLTQWVEWELKEIERQAVKRKLILIAHGRTTEERIRKLNFALQALKVDKRIDIRDGANAIVIACLDQQEPVEVHAFSDDLFAFLDATTLGIYLSVRR